MLAVSQFNVNTWENNVFLNKKKIKEVAKVT